MKGCCSDKSNRRIWLSGFATVIFFAAVFGMHGLLQNPAVHAPLKGVFKTYDVSTDGKGGKCVNDSDKAFERIEAEKMNSWDAEHYKRIKETLYSTERTEGWAFFPLFSLLWRATGLDSLGIGLLNCLLFAVGILIMLKLFEDKLPSWGFLLVFCVPYLVVFMMPYTEALFFLCMAAGLYGMVKEKYWLYFAGFLLACMTKASASLLILVFLFAEIISAAYHRKPLLFLVGFGKRVLPVVLGVLCVMVFQKLRGAESFHQFFISQKIWGKYLSLPSLPFTDWSSEGRSITNPFLLLYFVPMVLVLLRAFLGGVCRKAGEQISAWRYTRLVCLLFLTGNVFTALLTQHGGLYSLARYLLATPFFVFLLFDTVKNQRSRIWEAVYVLIGLACVVLCRDNFTKADCAGTYLVMLGSLLAFFHRRIGKGLLCFALAAGILFNVCWTAYMFNCFLLDAWIFT